MVYDSHEHWPQLFKAVRTYRSKPGLINAYLSWLTPRWSKTILDKAPVITVSPTIAQDYRKHGRVFLVPNYPNELEVSLMKNRKKPQNKLSCVIVGKDFPTQVSFRDTSGLLEALTDEEAAEVTLIGPPKNLSFSKGHITCHIAFNQGRTYK